jgi:hypothetical protein
VLAVKQSTVSVESGVGGIRRQWCAPWCSSRCGQRDTTGRVYAPRHYPAGICCRAPAQAGHQPALSLWRPRPHSRAGRRLPGDAAGRQRGDRSPG